MTSGRPSSGFANDTKRRSVPSPKRTKNNRGDESPNLASSHHNLEDNENSTVSKSPNLASSNPNLGDKENSTVFDQKVDHFLSLYINPDGRPEE